MIPYTLSTTIQQVGALVVGQVIEANLGPLPRPLVLEKFHAECWITAPGNWQPELFLRVDDHTLPAPAALNFRPLRTYGDYRVLWTYYSGAVTDRWRSAEFDTYHEGIVLPQCGNLICGFLASAAVVHVARMRVQVSGHLQMAGMLNSMEVNQCQIS